MKRWDNPITGTVTIEVSDRQYINLDQMAVRNYGVAEMLRQHGLGHLLPTERVPVMQYGRRVGTMPTDFDGTRIESKSFLYDGRPGDFVWDGDVWVVSRTLGASDLDMVVGFVRDEPNSDPA